MRRIWLGIGILIFFLVSGMAASMLLDHICLPVSENLSHASKLAQNGDFNEAVLLAQKAHETWDHYWHGIGTLADHSPMDEIDGLFSQAEAYAAMGAYTDFSASCARLSKLVTAVSEAHSLNWWNLI